MASFDPVLIHNAPRSNTVINMGGPIGPYAVGKHTPPHEIPDKAPQHNKDIRRATGEELRHYLAVQGRNVTYMTMKVALNSLKRIAYNEDKQTIWETKWIDSVLNRLYDSHLHTNRDLTSLDRFKAVRNDRNRRAQLHIHELRQYALPQSSDDSIINAAIELQRNIDQHQWLREDHRPINSCPESELRAHRRGLINWYLPNNPEIDTHSRDAYCYLISGGWTHHMRHSLTKNRYNNVARKYEPVYGGNKRKYNDR